MQLSLLAVATITILATGLALLMYPAVFSDQVILSGRTLRIAFFGFCALSVLLVAYLLDRHVTLRRLRRQLLEELRRNVDLRREASADLLKTLPGLTSFQDRLAMEYRRAASMQRPLSLVVISLKPADNLSDKSEITAAFGDAAKALCRKLREEDSIHLFCPGFFGILLPCVDTPNASHAADRLAEGLHDAAGVTTRFTYGIHLFNYPEHAATASELQQAVRSLLPEDLLERTTAGKEL
jgi:GGDEF domain-containing protein